MATLACCADGNFSASATWALCDATAELDSEAGNSNLPTAGGASSDSSTFQVAAGSYDAILLKFAQRNASPSGTMTVVLRTGGADVAGTSVTINITDLQAIGASVTPGGWIL